MEIKTEREDGILIANVNGRVDSANAREFENVLSSAISDDDTSVVVDFGGLSYISSSGPAGHFVGCQITAESQRGIRALLALWSHRRGLQNQRI